MSTAPTPPSPDIPPIKEYKSAQYEFNDEQNRAISGLTDAMRVVAGLMQLLGLAFVVLCALTATAALKAGVLSRYGPPIGFGVAAILFLCIGFWTGGAATSFRKIVETKNEDLWHLMNALGSLHNMYGLLRTIILGGLVLSVIAGAMIAFAWMEK
jgi:FtsH-binding integral membrane protein